MLFELKEDKYKKKLESIKKRIKEIEDNSRSTIVPYSPHGISHNLKLEELLNVLFPGEEIDKVNKIFSEKEKFLLFAAIWLHDIGMYPQLFPEDPKPTTCETEELKEWEKNVLRRTHSERSKDYILQRYNELDLEDEEARDLALICKSHCRSQKMPEYTDEKLLLIIAYLRLLDALHIPDRPSRDKVGNLRTYLAYGMDPVSKFHWYKSFYVSKDIEPHPNELKLIIKFALPERWSKNNGKEKMFPLIRTIETDIKDELDAIRDILIKSKVKYGLPAYIYMNYEFKLTTFKPEEVDELESLLAIIKLFDPAISPNAGKLIDIVLDGIERYVDIKALESYRRDILEPLLKDRSCHVYLWKVRDELEKKFENLKKGSIDEKKFAKEIQVMIKALKEKRKHLKKELPKKVLEILSIDRKDPIDIKDTILLYGYSSSIVNVLGALHDDIKQNIELIVCECIAKNKHRYDNKLIYCDGIQYLRELREIGIKNIYYSPDMCASNLFSKGKLDNKEENFKKITKVFFGTNGIDEKRGTIAHDLGHLAIADLAKKYGINVYVIAESMKIGKLTENPTNLRKETWFPTDIIFDGVNEYNSYNPREDIVSLRDITGAILTENGASPPNALSEISSNIDDVIRDYEEKNNVNIINQCVLEDIP